MQIQTCHPPAETFQWLLAGLWHRPSSRCGWQGPAFASPAPLQLLWLPSTFSNKPNSLLPQSLCTSSFLFLRLSFLGLVINCLSFKPQGNHHFPRGLFPDHPIETAPPGVLLILNPTSLSFPSQLLADPELSHLFAHLLIVHSSFPESWFREGRDSSALFAVVDGSWVPRAVCSTE